MAAGIFILAVGPSVVQPGLVPVAFSILGAAYFAVTLSAAGVGLVDRLLATMSLIAQIGWRIIPDLY